MRFAREDSRSRVLDLERRVGAVVQAYDAQGHHRTATPEDCASAEWLAAEIRRCGIACSLEPFAVDRVDPRSCHALVAGRRVEGVPMFDAGFTSAEGVCGRLGPLGADTEIGLAQTELSNLAEAGSERQRALLPQLRESRHRAVILLTRGSKPGLFLLNAPLFDNPFGPPTLQVSSAESEWLRTAARQGAEATIVVHAQRTRAHAVNVTATISGSHPALPPVVIMTPRSGWWQCASERGGGIACWLEALLTAAAEKPARDCLFVALSGHELGGLGIHAYLERREGLARQAHAWIQIGANIGASRQSSFLAASDAALERWAVAAMEKNGLALAGKAKRGSAPFGEAAIVHRMGGRYAALICGSELFHSAADRWPNALDVRALARYAGTLAHGVLELAQST